MMDKIIKKIIRFYVRRSGSDVFRSMHPYSDMVAQGLFEGIYQNALVRTGTPPSIWRKDRFFNLFSLVNSLPQNALTLECGAWKGLSSRLICAAVSSTDASYVGQRHYIVDSFEGLSAPTEKDRLPASLKNHLASPLDNVKKNLSDFPEIKYIKGYIPQVLPEVPDKNWDFVHVDVDLAEPTQEAIRYFFPRLTEGGAILCDDYASVLWPGTKGAVDEICKRLEARTIPLSTGQLIIIRK